MQMILEAADVRALPLNVQDALIEQFFGRQKRAPSTPDLGDNADYKGMDMDECADLTFREIQTWMSKASDATKSGLRVFAEKGPVIQAKDLTDAGIENISHFQSRTTIRTRTVTGDSDLFLLGWDDWTDLDEGEGRYAVTPITYQSLRRFFQLA